MALSTKARRQMEVTLANKVRAKELCDAIDAGSQDARPGVRFTWTTRPIPGGTSWITSWGSGPTVVGTSSADSASGIMMVRFDSTNTGSTLAGVVGNTVRCFMGQTPRSLTWVKTDSDISQIRCVVGLSSSSNIIQGDTQANAGVYFRYSTSAGDTTWKAVTNFVSGTPLVTDTGVPVLASTLYKMSVDCTDLGVVRFWINDQLVATVTDVTRIPASTVAVHEIALITNLIAANRFITVGPQNIESL